MVPLILLWIGCVPDVTIATADGKIVAAAKIAVKPRNEGILSCLTAGGKSESIRCEDITEISFSSGEPSRPEPKPSPEDIVAILNNWDVLKGTLTNKTTNGFILKSEAYGEIDLKLDCLSAIQFTGARTAWPRKNPEKIESNDLFYYASGDRDDGTISSLSREGIEYLSNTFGKKTVAPKDMAAIYLALVDKTAIPPETNALEWIVTVREGSTLRGKVTSIEEGILTLQSPYGWTLRASLSNVSTIFFKNGRIVYLSDLPFAKPPEENANFIRGETPLASDLVRPCQRDRSAAEGPLLLRGMEYRKGLGVHSRSVLTFDISAGYRRFDTLAGIDDCAQGRGDVIFQVFVDGRKIWDSGSVKGNEKPRTASLDISEGKELQLVVDFGETGSMSDYADWAQAHLIR